MGVVVNPCICGNLSRNLIQRRKVEKDYWIGPQPWSWSALGHLYVLKGLVDSLNTYCGSHGDALPAYRSSGSKQRTLPVVHMQLLSWMISGLSCGSPGPTYLLTFLSEVTPNLTWGLPNRKNGPWAGNIMCVQWSQRQHTVPQKDRAVALKGSIKGIVFETLRSEISALLPGDWVR